MNGIWEKLKAVLKLHCPRCGKESMFINSKLIAFSQIAEMPDECSNCGQDFQIEEGFYYGAMFTSYFLTAFILFFLMGLVILINGYLERWQLFTFIGLVALFWSYIFRISRTIWLTFIFNIENSSSSSEDSDKE